MLTALISLLLIPLGLSLGLPSRLDEHPCFPLCDGPPIFQEEYRGNYIPSFINTENGPQILAPDTPYVAVAGRNKLHFIDTRINATMARHIKEQIERAMVGKPDEYISIDEFAATAEVKRFPTGETVFVFDPYYARILFAHGMNRNNPELNLPEYHGPTDDWEVIYDPGT